MAENPPPSPPTEYLKKHAPSFQTLPPELRQSILLKTNPMTTYPPFPPHPSTHPLGLSFFEIHAYHYITSSLKWSAALRQVFDPHNGDMNFVQGTWVKDLISAAKEAERENRDSVGKGKAREVTMVEGVEMGAELAGIVGPLVAKGLEGCRK